MHISSIILWLEALRLFPFTPHILITFFLNTRVTHIIGDDLLVIRVFCLIKFRFLERDVENLDRVSGNEIIRALETRA